MKDIAVVSFRCGSWFGGSVAYCARLQHLTFVRCLPYCKSNVRIPPPGCYVYQLRLVLTSPPLSASRLKHFPHLRQEQKSNVFEIGPKMRLELQIGMGL